MMKILLGCFKDREIILRSREVKVKRIQKFISYILILTMLCSLFQGKTMFVTFAEEIALNNILEQGSCGDNLTYTITKDKVLTILGNGALTDSNGWYQNQEIEKIVIENGVTSIREEAFRDLVNVKSVVMGDSVEIIEARAFMGLHHLADISFSKNLKEVGDMAFSWCYDLQDAVFPESLKKIGSNIFQDSGNIRKIVIQEGVTDIASGAFSGCKLLEEIILPSTLKHCGENIVKGTAFYNNKNNWENGVLYSGSILLDATTDCGSNLKVKEGTTLIADNAFYGNEIIETVSLPDGIKGIGKSAFYANKNIEAVSLPDSIEGIGERAFFDCQKIKSIILPPNLKKIEMWVFAGCYQLKDVTFPEGLEEIGFEAFGSCDMESIIIPESVTQIGKGAFARCDKLKEITFPKSLQYCGADVIKDTAFYDDQSNWENGILYCDGILLKTNDDCEANIKIKPGIRLIADYAFYPNEIIQNLDFGEDVAVICKESFFCKNLKSIILSPKLIKIGDYAFKNSTKLSEVTFLNKDTEIGVDAFYEGKNCIFYGLESSTAQQYTIGKNIQFKLLSEKETTVPPETTTPQETTSKTALYETTSTDESTSVITTTDKGASIVPTTPVETTALDAVKNHELKISITHLKEKNWHSVKVRWTKKAGIKSYILYRSKKKRLNYKRISTTTVTSYLDTKVKAGKKYYYKVIATDDSGRNFTSKPKAVKVKGVPKIPKIQLKITKQSWQIYWGILNDNSKGIDIYMKNDELKHKKYVLINRTTNIKKSRKKKGTTGIQSALSTLSKNRTYKFKARTYAVVKGKKVYSKWSKTIRYTRK